MMAAKGASDGLSQDERDAVKQRAKELREQEKAGKNREAGLASVRKAIDELEADDKVLAEGLHAVVTDAAPALVPKTYYGMPGYADANGKVVVFFQSSAKFKTRYSTIGFQDSAALDDGDLWPIGFAVRAWTPAVEEKITELITTAVS
ncbi:iron chaperone [Microbacterium lemovicicum]